MSVYGVLYPRLLQHAVSLRQLSHRNIATVYDAFLSDSCTSGSENIDPGGQTSSISVYIIQVVTLVSFLEMTYSHSGNNNSCTQWSIQYGTLQYSIFLAFGASKSELTPELDGWAD